MKYGQNISNNEMDTSPKKKYLSPSIRLCKALSLECVMNEGPASFIGNTPDEDSDDEEVGNGGLIKHSKSFYYSGYDSDF